MAENPEAQNGPMKSNEERYNFDWVSHGSAEVPAEVKSECDKLIDIAEAILSGAVKLKAGADVSQARLAVTMPKNTRYVTLAEGPAELKSLAKEVYRIHTLKGESFYNSFKGQLVGHQVENSEIEAEANNALSAVHSVLDQLKKYYDISD